MPVISLSDQTSYLPPSDAARVNEKEFESWLLLQGMSHISYPFS